MLSLMQMILPGVGYFFINSTINNFVGIYREKEEIK